MTATVEAPDGRIMVEAAGGGLGGGMTSVGHRLATRIEIAAHHAAAVIHAESALKAAEVALERAKEKAAAHEAAMAQEAAKEAPAETAAPASLE